MRKLTEKVQVNLRIRESLRRRLKDAAVKANNSLNTEMIRRIELSFQQEDIASQIRLLNDMFNATMRDVFVYLDGLKIVENGRR